MNYRDLARVSTGGGGEGAYLDSGGRMPPVHDSGMLREFLKFFLAGTEKRCNFAVLKGLWLLAVVRYAFFRIMGLDDKFFQPQG